MVGIAKGTNDILRAAAALLFALAAGSSLGSCRPAEPAEPADAPKTLVETWVVQTTDLEEEVVLPGLLEAKRSATLSAEVAAPVAEVLVEAGDEVAAGTTLLRFDRTELEKAVGGARASMEALVHRKAEVEKGAREEQVREAQAMLEAAKANRDLAEAALARRRALADQSVLPAEALDQAKTQAAMAKAEVERAEETVALLRKGARAETLKAFDAQIEAAKASLELAALRLAKAEVRSPFAGVVQARRVEAFEFAAPGQPLFEILETSPVVVRLGVPERIFMRLHEGDPVTVRFKSLPGALGASITRLAFAADRNTQTFEVRVEIDNPAEVLVQRPGGAPARERVLLRPGLLAKVVLRLGVHRDAVAVPTHALVMDGANLFVYVEAGGKVEARPVEIGLQKDGVFEILSGLSPGENLVVAGQRYVRHGESVDVVETHAGEVRP